MDSTVSNPEKPFDVFVEEFSKMLTPNSRFMCNQLIGLAMDSNRHRLYLAIRDRLAMQNSIGWSGLVFESMNTRNLYRVCELIGLEPRREIAQRIELMERRRWLRSLVKKERKNVLPQRGVA